MTTRSHTSPQTLRRLLLAAAALVSLLLIAGASFSAQATVVDSACTDDDPSTICPECNDGIDNDGNGDIDYTLDPECSSADDLSEGDPYPECDDGVDNDGDGAVDYPTDNGCDSPSDDSENSDAGGQNNVCGEVSDTFSGDTSADAYAAVSGGEGTPSDAETATAEREFTNVDPLPSGSAVTVAFTLEVSSSGYQSSADADVTVTLYDETGNPVQPAKSQSITASTLGEGDTDSDYQQGSVSFANAGGTNRIAIEHHAAANAGPGGSVHGPTEADASAALNTVQIANPNCDCTIDAFSASVDVVNPGDSFRLNWASSDVAGDLTAGGTWSGQKNQSGTSTLSAPSPPGTYEYTLSGVGASGLQCSASETIAVNKIPETLPDGDPDAICVPLSGGSTIDVVKNDGTGAGTYLDQEGDPIYIASVQPGGAGLVTDTDGSSDFEPGDHALVYNPAATGTQSFTYTIQDAHGGQSAPETVYTNVKRGCGQVSVTFSADGAGAGTGSADPRYNHPAIAGGQLPTQSVAVGATTTWNVPLKETAHTATLKGDAITYNFDDGTTQGWTRDANDFAVKSNRSYSGGFALGIQKSNASEQFGAHIEPSELSGGKQIESFSFYYNEDGNSHGGGLRLRDSDGNVVTGVATDNPAWITIDVGGDGETTIAAGPQDFDYDDWVKVAIDFDWAAGTAEITFSAADDPSDAASDTVTLGSDNIARIDLENYNKGFTGDDDWKMWYDGFSFVTSGDVHITAPPGYRVAQIAGGPVTKNTEVADFTNSQTSAQLGEDYPAAGNSAPTARFSYTPTLPQEGETVSFDAASSTAPDGGTIESYKWDINSTTFQTADRTGQTMTKSFSNAGDHPVTLQVTDDDGATATTSQTVSVSKPTTYTLDANFSWSPSGPTVSEDSTISFTDTTTGKDPSHTYTYDWNFDDPGSDFSNTSSQPNPTHDYLCTAGYDVTLEVTDETTGETDGQTHNIVVGIDCPTGKVPAACRYTEAKYGQQCQYP